MNTFLLLISAGLTTLWGIAHLFPTKNVVKGFGEISADNKHIITMEWINEGVTLIFSGILTATIALVDPQLWLAQIIALLIVFLLIVLAIISLLTGFRVNFLPYKLCPLIFSVSAILILIAVFT